MIKRIQKRKTRSTTRPLVHQQVLDSQKHFFEAQFKTVFSSLENDIHHALIEAIGKTFHSLQLMSKVQQPKSLFMDCVNLFEKQQHALMTLMTNTGFTASMSPALVDSSLNLFANDGNFIHDIKSIERLKSARHRNSQQCLQSYRNLLRKGPLLEHLKALPESCKQLLSLSPEKCIKALLLSFERISAPLSPSTELMWVNSTILTSLFYNRLTQTYFNVEAKLNAFFQEHLPLLQNLNPEHQYTEVHTLSIRQEKLEMTLEQSDYSSDHPIVIDLQPSEVVTEHHFTSQAIMVDRHSAIERQTQARLNHERIALTQLKQMPLGTIICWQGSHLDRSTQRLKLVNHEPEAQRMAFHDEKTGEFLYYSFQQLVQALLSGEIIKMRRKSSSRSLWQKLSQRLTILTRPPKSTKENSEMISMLRMRMQP